MLYLVPLYSFFSSDGTAEESPLLGSLFAQNQEKKKEYLSAFQILVKICLILAKGFKDF